MIYSGSTAYIQAMALGIPTIHLRPQFDFNHDSLEGWDDIRLEAFRLEELKHRAHWLLNHREEYVTAHRDK